jgi:hypothetical protein
MKSILDFYECGLNATPANTMGMGNPMAPTDTEVGSEPLVPNKKKKKTKSKEKIDEASILDIEGTMTEGDDIANVILEYAKHLAYCAKQYEKVSYTEEEIVELSINAINNKVLATGSPGEIIFDFSGFKNIKDRKMLIFVRELFYNYGTIMIDSKKFPKSVKKLTLKNFERECEIDLYGDNDISNLDITVEGGSALIIKTKESTNIVKLGKILCSEFVMSDDIIKNVKSTGISFKNGSSIENIDLRNCTFIESISGSNLGTTYFTLNKNIIRHNLIKSGLADQKTRITLE